MINKTLEQLANEMEDTLQRISKIRELGAFYIAKQIVLDHKGDERPQEGDLDTSRT